MTSSYIPISNLQLSFAVFLVLITGGVSALLRLGLLKSLVWGTIRTVIQLTLVGYVLAYVFSLDSPVLVLGILTAMCLVAARTATSRAGTAFDLPSSLAFISLFCSTFLIGSLVVGLIIAPEPVYSARIVIPIFGMILGNSMNAVALGLDRLYSDAKSNSPLIETLLAFGATPWESIRPSVVTALRAGMTPTINSLMTVGIVSLPGMMTGQILSGIDPRQAVRYQIVVLLMVAAAGAVSCLLVVSLAYKRLFNKDGALHSNIRGQ